MWRSPQVSCKESEEYRKMAIMMRTGKTQSEAQHIIREIAKWKSYDRKQIEPSRKYLEDVISGSIIQKANNLFPNNPSEYIKFIKNSEIKTTTSESITSVGFNQLDINSLLASEGDNIIPSYFNFVNKSYSDGGYYRGQIILLSMSPGSGKSLMAAQEALNMAINGYKVHYLVLGDLQSADFIIRLCALYSGLPFKMAKDNIKTIYNSLCQIIGDRLQFTILPAGVITVDEYVDFIINKDFDTLIVDYDGNFKANFSDNNLYLVYGDIYEKLTRLTQKGFLLFVLSQSKITSWGNPEIGLNEISESSKKQQNADMIITRGKEPNCPNHLGVFKIVKNRRGEVDIKDYSIRLNNGRFMSIPKGVYDILKREIKEETNLDLTKVISYINYFDYLSRSGKKCRQFNFKVEVTGGPIVLTEHDTYKWVKLDEIETQDVSNEIRECLMIYKFNESNYK